MAREKPVGVKILVGPELDKRKTSTLISDWKKVQKQLEKTDIGFKDLAKTASLNVREIKKLATAAEHVGKGWRKSSKEAYSAFQELGQLGDQLEKARGKLRKLAKTAESTKPGERGAIDKQIAKQAKLVGDLNNKVEVQKKKANQHTAWLEKGTKAQQKNVATLKKAANVDIGEVFKSVLGSLSAKDLKGALAGVGKGVGGLAAKGGGAAAEAMGGAGGSQAMAAMGAAAAGITGAVAAIGLFIKLLTMASDHMTKLNKALLQGSTLAGDFGQTAQTYHDTIRALSQAAQDSHASLLRFGLDSEKAMGILGAFTKTASGSM